MAYRSEDDPRSAFLSPAWWCAVLFILLTLLVNGSLGFWVPLRGIRAQAAPLPHLASIVGAWLLEARGAPFVPHVALFFSDQVMVIDNPEAGDPHTSDSLGAGAWRLDPRHPNTINGQFQEINADRASGHYASRLVVTFTLVLTGANLFQGYAAATYFSPDGARQNDQPYPATLSGTRIQP